jgi:hypothetical protein
MFAHYDLTKVSGDIEDIFVQFYKDMIEDMKGKNKILKKAKGNELGDFDFQETGKMDQESANK